MALTELTVSNPFHMPSVTCTLAVLVRSQSQPQYTVNFRFRSPPLKLTHLLFNNLDAHNVCTRAKNHYDPQQVHRLFSPEMAETEDSTDRARARRGGRGGRGGRGRGGGDRNTARDGESEFRTSFQQAHERMATKMYFC